MTARRLAGYSGKLSRYQRCRQSARGTRFAAVHRANAKPGRDQLIRAKPVHSTISPARLGQETGGILITPLPGATPLEPGAATLPFFGVEPVLVDADGNELPGNDRSGNLCLKRSWPGQARTIYGDHERFVETYFSTYSGMYLTGDGCRRDGNGYYWITGRVDDVLNVSGHRLGTAEIESALVAHDAVAEAAVVGCPHEIKGVGIYAYVLITPEAESRDQAELAAELRQQVRTVIGPIATPDHIHVAAGLPKTRSGKIMRRVLRKIAAGEYDDLGDVTTLAEPAVVDGLVADHRAATG